MIMIIHEAISVADPMVAFINISEEIEETLPIAIL
jgi:hypothetical protein